MHRSDPERGASAVEYGLLISGIAAVIASVVYLLGGAVRGQMSDACNAVSGKITTTLDNAGYHHPAAPDCDD